MNSGFFAYTGIKEFVDSSIANFNLCRNTNLMEVWILFRMFY